MDQPFPFGLPAATAFYLALYLLTWSLHWAFMHYVAAGCAWILWGTIDDALLSGRVWHAPPTRTLLSWLPFLISMAITAGVAPLLFVQILYATAFYSANLLLFWNWLLIIPALISLFYLLYLLQAWRDCEGCAWARVGLALAALGCVTLVGGLWISNHTIANAGLPAWTAIYSDDHSPFAWPLILARGAVAIGMAFPGMAMLLGWQLWQGTSKSVESIGAAGSSNADVLTSDSSDVTGAKWLGITGLCGLAIACTGGSILFNLLPENARAAIVGPFAFSYLIALAIGIAGQMAAWNWLAVTNRWQWLPLSIATAGYVVSLVSLSVVREAIRLAALGYESFREVHERAATVDGLTAFLVFAALNAGLIAFCVWLVARNETVPPPQE